MQPEPYGVHERDGDVAAARCERRQKAKQEDGRQEHNADGECAVAGVDHEDSGGEDQAEDGLNFAGVDGHVVVRSVEHLSYRDEVEEQRGDGGGHCDETPARTVVQHRGQHGE